MHTLHLISSQTSQEGIECTKAKESYCHDIYTVGQAEAACRTPLYYVVSTYVLDRNTFGEFQILYG